MSDSFGTPWSLACQALLPLGFLRQEYWSGLPFPFPGDLPNPGIEPTFPSLVGGFFTTEPLGKPNLSESLTKETKGDEVLAICVPEADFTSFVADSALSYENQGLQNWPGFLYGAIWRLLCYLGPTGT